MKKIFLLCCTLPLFITSIAQTEALDFKKTDCADIDHHLFAELDSGYVCILDFIMFDCSHCVVATKALQTIHAQFEALHPGRVRFYSIGFLDFMTCTQMNSWKSRNNYQHPMFAGDADQVNYYGGMGMPTIIILGGRSAHKVYYNQLGYSSAEHVAIVKALNLAIQESTITDAQELPADALFNILPNPFDEMLSVQIPSSTATHFIIMDPTGREIFRQNLLPKSSDTKTTLPVGHLQPGFYLFSLFDGKQLIGLRKLIKT